MLFRPLMWESRYFSWSSSKTHGKFNKSFSMDFMNHVLSGNIHPHSGVLQALQCGCPAHRGTSPGAAGHHLLTRDSAGTPGTYLLRLPEHLLCSYCFSLRSQRAIYHTFSLTPHCLPPLILTLKPLSATKTLRPALNKIICFPKTWGQNCLKTYILCIGLCNWKVHILQVSNNVSQYRSLLACFLQAISNSCLLKNSTYHCTLLSLWLYLPSSTVFFASFLCNCVSTKHVIVLAFQQHGIFFSNIPSHQYDEVKSYVLLSNYVME